MNVMLRVAAVTIALAVPAAVLALWMPTPHSSEGSVELRIPDRVGRWTATADREFAPEIVAKLGADAHILRRYEAPGRDPLWLFVSLYAGLGGHGSGAKYHDPEDCYPGQGWEISDYQPLEVRVSTSETLHAKLLQVRQGNLRQVVVYWSYPFRC